jgi:signal transduction histidine kinase
MTVPDGRRTGGRATRRPRRTLRLRLTVLNALLVTAAAALLLATCWAMVWPLATDGGALALLAYGGLALLAIGGVGVAGSWLVTGRALRPLQQVTATAQRLGGENLDERIGYAGTADEVAELAATFDAMLDRLAEAFEAQRRFVANASHELRTPLAVIRTEVDVTLAEPGADLAEYQHMGRVVREASQRANRLVEALLVLARSEAQSGRRLVRKVPADLATSAEAALTAMSAEAERMRLQVTRSLKPAPVVGDPSLLDRLAGNLVENAMCYNHLHGQIWVSSWVEGPHARLLVGNTGFEVDQADLPRLFEPFRRGGRERTGGRGFGLGLSIVRAVCDAHGGTVSARARDEGGLEVTVSLPAADRAGPATSAAPAGRATG